ncbi:hypothetical protein OAU47_05265, partial [Pelagibacterales bacterium]|nr:hypothetical protein [Pelagibacterales bacterium]
SEAIYSKKNVYIFRLKSKKKSNKIEIFNDKLLKLGHINELPSYLNFDETKYENETFTIAEMILKKDMIKKNE